MDLEKLNLFIRLPLSYISRCFLTSEYYAHPIEIRDEITDGLCLLKFKGTSIPLVIEVLSERREIRLSYEDKPCGKYSFLKDISENIFWKNRLQRVEYFSILQEQNRIYGIGLNFKTAPSCYIFYDDSTDSCRIGQIEDVVAEQ